MKLTQEFLKHCKTNAEDIPPRWLPGWPGCVAQVCPLTSTSGVQVLRAPTTPFGWPVGAGHSSPCGVEGPLPSGSHGGACGDGLFSRTVAMALPNIPQLIGSPYGHAQAKLLRWLPPPTLLQLKKKTICNR